MDDNRPPSVLIVEDEILVALDLEAIVESAGYRVAGIAADRPSALALAGQADVALVDVNLRDGPTGPDIARALAEEHGLAAVFVTANPGQISHLAGIALGYVQKPFAAAGVRRALAAALDGAGMDAPLAGFTPLPRPARFASAQSAG